MKFRVGLIGCGRISDVYLTNLARFEETEVVACASLDRAESAQKAAKFGIPRSCEPEEIFADPDIDAVLNLTIPAAHAEITLKALQSGKHVYSEKPFVTDLADGARILDLASASGLSVGNAPDTFLGGRWQTCRQLLDSGVIGAPTAVSVFVGTHGVERHNPNPDFYYLEGGGPLLDLGPYYLTAMIFLLGPVSRVAGLKRKTFDRRKIENGPRDGEWIPVEVDTHVESLLEFRSGVIGSMTMSFDVWDSETPRLEIHGEEGSLCIPDPDPVHGANDFHGPVWYRTRQNARWSHQPRPSGREQWLEAKNLHGYNENYRGLGLLDLAYGVRDRRPPRASGDMALHVSEIMAGILKSSDEAVFAGMNTSCERPLPLPTDFPHSEN